MTGLDSTFSRCEAIPTRLHFGSARTDRAEVVIRVAASRIQLGQSTKGGCAEGELFGSQADLVHLTRGQ
jgi:hypothetical protein